MNLGPRNSEKFGALLLAEGASLNLLVPLMAVWCLGTLASNFRGPGTAFPRFPLTLTIVLDQSKAISRKRCKIGGKLVLISNRKSYMRFR